MREYGGSTADFTFDGDVTVPNVSLAVATDNNAAARIITGIYDMAGNPVTQITSDSLGEIRFQGDDALPLDLYLTTIDGGGNLGSVWYVVRATDLGAAVTQAAADAKSSADSAAASAALVPADLAAQLDAIRARLDALESGGVPNAIIAVDSTEVSSVDVVATDPGANYVAGRVYLVPEA